MGERQTEDLKVPGSIPGLGIFSSFFYPFFFFFFRDLRDVGAKKIDVYSLNKVFYTHGIFYAFLCILLRVFFSFTMEKSVVNVMVVSEKESSSPHIPH